MYTIISAFLLLQVLALSCKKTCVIH